MKENFKQKLIYLDAENSTGKIKVEKLCSLIENHPYKDEIYKIFEVDTMKDEYISIDYVDLIYRKILYFTSNYKRYKISAETKNIDVFEESVKATDEPNIIFKFEEYIEVDEVKEDLKAISIYDSKNTFLDQYEMTKYANNLFKLGHADLARYNVQHFKNKAKENEIFNKEKSFRLVDYENKTYLRGVTSLRYYEYGIDFTFVVGMLSLHKNMKANPGTEYKIKSAAVSESKLEVIAAEKYVKDGGSFGQVSTAIKITTNDLGTGSLNFVNIISVNQNGQKGFYLIPKKDSIIENNSLIINHNTKPENVFLLLGQMDNILNTTESFIKEINSIKSIKTPDELRVKILTKINSPRSVFKTMKNLSDIFNRKINNEISNFSKLIEMCNKAEELDLEYDLKDKLRYIISDIILYGNSRE